MIKKTLLSVSIILVVLISSGCVTKTPNKEVLYEKGVHLTKLTRKVQVVIRNSALNSEELLIKMNKKYPKLMKEFTEYSIMIKNDNGIAVVLMCNINKEKALLEDAACSGELEGSLLFEQNLPCTFHLNIKEVCAE